MSHTYLEEDMDHLKFRNLVLAGAVVGLVLAQASPEAAAQAFPIRVVRITSMYPTGGTPDITARVVADKLARYWDKPVILEPRPGGNGLIAINAFKNMAADGHELLLLGGGNLSMAPNVVKNLAYDPINDFVPVSLIFRAPFVLVVSSTGPYKTMQGLSAAARANPERISYGSLFVGSPQHLGGAMLAMLTDTKMLPIHFKEASMLNTSIVNGDISFAAWTFGSVMSLVRSGRLKVLGVAARSRMASEPEVPTILEAGGPAGYEVDSWTAFLAPRGTPPEVARRVSADIARALAEADVKERFRGFALDPAPTTPDEMAKIIRAELARYANIVKRSGITVE